MFRLLYILLCCTVLALAVSTAAVAADICYPPQSVNNDENSDVLAWLDHNVNYSPAIKPSITDSSKNSESGHDQSTALICPASHADVHTNIATN
jgi:hypothetical protein